MTRHPPLRPYVMAWVPLVAVYTALYMGGGRPPVAAIRSALLTVLPFALLGLLVLRVPRRVPWRDERRAAFFAAQLALMTAYAVAAATGVIASWTLDSFLATGRAELPAPPMIAAWQALVGGLIYLAIAGAAYAWQNAQRVREEAARAAEAEALRARAELAALRSQLNPHFLLNTLHAALGLVRRDPALAERALERLGEVLHYGLRMHRESLDQVTVAEEWAFVRSYLEIESLRLEDRLQLRLEADPEAVPGLVPPFVLQPLVENAILHAVAPRKAGGRVAVTARRRGDHLQLEVCDDGPGMPAAMPSPGAGLGLRLLRERLALLYAGTPACRCSRPKAAACARRSTFPSIARRLRSARDGPHPARGDRGGRAAGSADAPRVSGRGRLDRARRRGERRRVRGAARGRSGAGPAVPGRPPAGADRPRGCPAHPAPAGARVHDGPRSFRGGRVRVGGAGLSAQALRRRALLPDARARPRPHRRAGRSRRGRAHRLALSPIPLRRLFARSGARIVPIPVASIRRVQAAGDYAEVHCATGRFLLQVSLVDLLSRLDPERFRQVHRSHIVNLDHVREMKPYDERRLLITIEGGEEILASRKASEDLRRLVR